MGNITDLTTSWEGYTKYDVEDIIKQEFAKDKADIASKFAASFFDQDKMMQYFFKSDEDLQEWKDSKEDSLILYSVPFNFSGTVSQVRVINGMPSATLYFTTQSSEAIISCSFLSQEKGITDSAWTDVNEDFEVSVAIDKGSTGEYITIINKETVLNGNSFSFNIRSSIATGVNRVRVTSKGLQSGSSASLTYTVNLTTMYLAPSNFTWFLPFVEGNVYNLGGLNIGGNLQKVLRIRVSREEAYLKEYEINIGDSIYTSTAYVFTGLEFPTAGSGVYNVELWLDANGLTSEHLSYNIICVRADEKSTIQLVSVSGNPETVLNFAENKLFNYCIYNKGLTTGSPVVSIDTIVNTNKTNLKTETLVDVPTGQALSYTASLEIEVVESKMQLSATMDFGNSQQIIYPIDNSKSFPATSEAIFYLNPAQRSNAQGNREKIVNSIDSYEYDAEWTNISWVENTDGWTKDNEGRMCLRVPAFSRANIALQPMADIRTPITLEFVYKVENASDYNDPIIAICDDATSDNFRGVKITPKNICLHSLNLKDSQKQDYNTIDESVMDVIITIVPNYKTNYGNLAQIYCNGVKVRSFEFTSITEWNTQANIILGSDTADLFVYKMRVYHKGFDKTDSIRNFINSLPDLASREDLYNKLLSVTNDSYDIDYDTCIKNGYNTMVIEMLGGKDIPSLLNQESGLLCNLKINIHNLIEGELDEEMEDLLTGELITGQSIEGQGTTAMTYGRWNFRWKLDKTYGKRRITAKKNVASSMQSHKMGATRMFNYLHKQCVGANEANANVAVLQYPVFGFQKILQDDGKTYKYHPIGLYTIGADKSDKHTFGYDNEAFVNSLIHLEGSDHTPKSVGFDYPWNSTRYSSTKDVEAMGAIVQDGIVGAWEVGAAGQYETDNIADEGNIQDMLNAEFKPAYDIVYNNSPLLICVEESLAEINADIDVWRAKNTPDGESYAAYEFFNKDTYNVIFYNELTKSYEETGVNLLNDLSLSASTLSDLSLEDTAKAVIDARKARFVSEWGNYWNVDDAIFHYVFMLVFGATDNYKKNTYPYKFKALDDGGKWRWRADDLDTIFDINNQGLAAKSYSILVGDKTSTGSGSIYRGDNSALWTLIKETQGAAIRAMVIKMLNAMVAHPNAQGSSTMEKLVGCVKYFFGSFAQDYFPESAYNVDAEWTYEDIWANKNAWKEVSPLSQALGGHREAENDWITMRMLFIASYYNFGPFVASGYKDDYAGQMAYGGAGAITYNITPAIDFNPTIIRGSTETITYGDRVMANTTVPLTVSSTTGADTRIYIQGLDWIKDLGDLSSLTVSADNPTLNISSKRLQRIKVGDEDASKIPTSATLKELSFGDCQSLMSIDARNLSTLIGTVDVSNLPRLKEAYFGGTNVAVVKLQDGSKIEELQLPASITELELKNLKFLKREIKETTDWDYVVGSYIATNKSVGTVISYTPVKESFNHLIVDCGNYTSFKVTGTGGSTPRLWCFVDSEDKVISVAAQTITVTDLELEIPSNAAKLIINFSNTKAYSLVGYENNVSFTIESLSNLSKLSIENCNLDGYALMKEAYESDNSQLSQIRLVGFDKEGDATDLAMLANMVNNKNAAGEAHTFTGIGTQNEVLGHPVIEGTMTIKTPIYPEDEDVLRDAYGEAFVLNAGGGYYIKFEDDPVKSICVTNWGDEVGISEEQAAAVTSIGNVFKGNTDITKFNELRYFINVKSLAGAFSDCTNLREIDLTNIESFSGNGSFFNCTSLAIEVDMPNLKKMQYKDFAKSGIIGIKNLGSITFIPDAYAYTENGEFYNCTNLEYVILPNTLTTIGLYAFFGCSKLSQCTFPVSIDTIKGAAFRGTILEGEINLPNLSTLEEAAFYETKISKVLNLGGIESIFKNTFRGCSEITEFVFPTNLKSILDSALYGCTSLEIDDLSLPNLETLEQNAFYGVKIKKISDLGKITTLPTATSSTQTFGDKSVLEEVVLPDTITVIPEKSFYGYSSAKPIVNWGNIVSIGQQAFTSTALEGNVELNVTSILSQTFYKTNITGIRALSAITIGNSAVSECKNLKFIHLRDVESIETRGFQINPNLEWIIVDNQTPPTLGSNNVFKDTSNCPIYVPDASVEAYRTATNWSDYADRIYPMSVYEQGGLSEVIEFDDENVKSICLANWDNNQDGYFMKAEAASVTGIGTVFKGNADIETFDEFEKFTGLTSIGEGAFESCLNLAEIKLPSNVKTIGVRAFEIYDHAVNPPSKTLDMTNVTVIGERAFHNSGLSGELNLPNLTSLGPYPFTRVRITGIRSLGAVTIIPNGSWNNWGAFSHNDVLERLVLPNNITNIGTTAFRDCPALKEVVLGDNISVIGDHSFYACHSLATFIVKATTPPSVSGWWIRETPIHAGTGSIYVPDDGTGEIVQAYKTATNWSSYASRIFPISQLQTDNPELYAEIEEYL